MVLNITVQNPLIYHPQTLNYLSAPHVLIRTAALASSSIYTKKVGLLAKNKSGDIFDWTNFFYKQSQKTDPINRLSYLFNVNHIILSQAEPHIAAFLTKNPTKSLISRIFFFVISEVQFRMEKVFFLLIKFAKLGLISNSIFSLFDQKVEGNVTIFPDIESKV